MPVVIQGQRAISVAPQAAAGTAAATYHWLARATAGHIRTMQTWDTPDLLTYMRITQVEDYPATRMAVAEITMEIDNQDIGLPLCGLAGRPTSGVWLIGALPPDLLTVTKANGLATCRQLIDGVVTSWGVNVTPMANGRAMATFKIMGLRTAPIAAPTITPPFTAGKLMRAGQIKITRNATAVRMLAFNAEFTQAITPDYATPLAVDDSVPFAEPDEMESPSVTGKVDALYKYAAYSGSALESSETATTEAWVVEGSRNAAAQGFKLELPVVQWEDPDEEDTQPRVKQKPVGKVLYAPSIAALAKVTLTGSSLDYALS